MTNKIVAAVYITGILPIKKDGSWSAISDFREYTKVKPRKFAEYVGFTEAEVKRLCRAHSAGFVAMKTWYAAMFSQRWDLYMIQIPLYRRSKNKILTPIGRKARLRNR